MESKIHVNINELPLLLKHNYIFIDLRTPQQYNEVHLQKFINVPYDIFINKHFLFPKDIPIYLICHTGKLSTFLANKLNLDGYLAYSLKGGMYAITNPINQQYY